MVCVHMVEDLRLGGEQRSRAIRADEKLVRGEIDDAPEAADIMGAFHR